MIVRSHFIDRSLGSIFVRVVASHAPPRFLQYSRFSEVEDAVNVWVACYPTLV